MVREMIPGPLLSDEARVLFESKLIDIARQIGPKRFLRVLHDVIDICDRRPTIAMLRKLAGMQRIEPRPPFVSAWNLVTQVVSRHLQSTPEGSAKLVPYIHMNGSALVSDPIPSIPPAVQTAVNAMGGWGSLAQSYPDWWSAKLNLFKEIYDPNEQASLDV